jgi:PAS domain S-box-containing protein
MPIKDVAHRRADRRGNASKSMEGFLDQPFLRHLSHGPGYLLSLELPMEMQNLPTKVLCIGGDEDHRALIRGLASSLSGRAYDVEWVSDYGRALEAIVHGTVDIGILGDSISGRSSLEFLKEARAGDSRIPIIFVTARSGEAAEAAALGALELGAAHGLTKSERSIGLLERSILSAIRHRAAEGSVRTSEERFRLILDHISDAVFLTDEIGNFTYICPNAQEIFGYSCQEVQALGNITGLLGEDLFLPDALEFSGEIRNIERWVTDKAGRVHNLLVNVKRVRIHGASRLYSCRDISDLKQSREALTASEARLSAIVENLPVEIWTADRDLRYVMQNAQSLAHYGDVRGMLVEEMEIPLELKSQWLEQDRKVLGGEVVREEYSRIDAGGEERHYQRVIAPVMVAGEVLEIVGLAMDVTEQHRSRQRLLDSHAALEHQVGERTRELSRANEASRKRESFIRSIFDGLSASICILDEEGFILDTNEPWQCFARANGMFECRFTGRNYLEVCDRAEGEWAEGADRAAAGIREVIAGSRDLFEMEYPCHSPHEERWFIARVTRFRDRDPVQVVVAHENVTQRRHAERLQRTQLRQFLNVLSNLHAGVLLVTEDQRVEFVNQAFCELFDLDRSPGALRGLKSSEIIDQIRNQFAEPASAVDRIHQILDRGVAVRNEEVALRGGRTCLRDFIPLSMDGRRYGRLWHYQDITERKRAEVALQRANEEITRRHRIATILLTATEERVYGEILEVVLEQMESHLGYLGYIDDQGDLVCPSMTQGIWDQCRIPDKEIRFPRDCWAGLWGRSLMDRGTKLANSKLTTPEGHLPLHRALATPVLWNGELIGQIAVANKGSDYTLEDQKRLESMADYIAPLLKARLLRKEHEAERKRDEEKLRLNSLVLDQIQDRVAITDIRGRLSYVNDSQCRALKRSRQELIGQSAECFGDDPARGATQREILEETLACGQWRGEVVNIGSDGTETIVDVRTTMVRDEEGMVVALCGVGTDITERKRAEEELQKYKQIVSYAPDRIALVDRDYRYRIVNDTYELYLGEKREQIIGRKVAEFVGEDVFQKYVKEYFDRSLMGEVVNYEAWFSYATLGRRCLDITYFPYVDNHGQILGVVGEIKDVTERRLAEEALRESEALLNSTQRLTRVGGWEWDVDRQIMSWTDETYRIHGLEPENLNPGSPEHIARSLACYEPEDRIRIANAFGRCAEQGEPYDMELPFTTADGRRLWIRTTANPEWDGQRVVRVMGNIMDITERKQAEGELLEKKRMLEEQARHLEEVNTALKVLLDRREEEKRKVVQDLHANIQQLIAPYLEKAKTHVSDFEGRTLLGVMESNLSLLADDLIKSLPVGSSGLTPTEMRVADLVRHGKSNKEIAGLLGMSVNAVGFHRKNIRKKLGLNREKINLQTFLRSSS